MSTKKTLIFVFISLLVIAIVFVVASNLINFGSKSNFIASTMPSKNEKLSENLSKTASELNIKPSSIKGGIIGKEIKNGKLTINNKEYEILNSAFEIDSIDPGIYSLVIKNSNGEIYLATPASLQIYPGQQNALINIY
ncbi:MAG: hypothetical protein NTZ65_02735 [Candidatus Berkelbacteria bacterium]|nr:hypothetical protein [Candidatus Berkelbacteria bacterium]